MGEQSGKPIISINSADYLAILIYLSQKIGFNKTAILSTVEIAKDMNFSQQTASRKMQELEEMQFIKKEYSPDGLKIGLTEKSAEFLKMNYNQLKNLLEKKTASTIIGIVTSGIGEGRFYVQIQKYNQVFTNLLGKKPFPGTLNIAVDKDDYREFLLNQKFTRIEGFRTKERSFGWIDCFRVKIKLEKINKHINGFIIMPERTTHPENIAEIIAPVYLRGELKLRDNDKVVIE